MTPAPCRLVNGIIHLKTSMSLKIISRRILSARRWIRPADGSIPCMPSAPCCLTLRAYKNVICLGLILDGQGQKMSKSRGNVETPWSVIDKNGADAMRWYLYTASPPGQERRFSSDLVGEVLRNFTLTLWNTYSFFVTYANLDGWKPEPGVEVEYNSLDKWLRSTLHTLIRDVTKALGDIMTSLGRPGRSRPLWSNFPTGICADHAGASGRASRIRTSRLPTPHFMNAWLL